MKKTHLLLAGLAAALFITGCNKEEKLMKRLEGNWVIDKSVTTIRYADGSEQTIEDLSNAGKLVISEGASDNEKNYDLLFIDSNQDTMKSQNQLVTDEYNNRMVMVNAYEADTAGTKKNIVWTIEKEKKNKQVWSTYGVDSTLFYPANNMNPGAAGNWVMWQITLKRE